jgi:hypothetical protein
VAAAKDRAKRRARVDEFSSADEGDAQTGAGQEQAQETADRPRSEYADAQALVPGGQSALRGMASDQSTTHTRARSREGRRPAAAREVHDVCMRRRITPARTVSKTAAGVTCQHPA